MAIEFTCPGCGGTLRVGDGPGDRLVRCGGCLTLLRVPRPDAGPDDLPGPEPAPPTPPPPRPAVPQAPDHDPNHGEPDPSDRSGRGLLFWLVVALGLIAFGTVLCCAGLVVLAPEPKWRTVESPAGGFKVDLPGDPRTDLSLRGVRHDPRLKVLGARLWIRQQEYAVIYGDIPAAERRGHTDAEILDDMAKAFGEGEVIRRNEAAAVGGLPGREIELADDEGGIHVVRMVIAENRLFVLVAGGRSVRPGDQAVRRFLDSFTITDAKLLGAADQERFRQAGAAVARVPLEQALRATAVAPAPRPGRR